MKFNDIITNKVVFQANSPVRIIGSGTGKLTIEFMGELINKEIKDDNWVIELSSHDYGGPYILNYSFDGINGILEDIYFGDVYLMSGQSNMQFKLEDGYYPDNEKVGVNNLRFYSTYKPEEGEPFNPLDGWVTCEKNNVNLWSFLGYVVGKELVNKTNHMIGIINAYQGAADIQSYLPERCFSKYPHFNLPDADRFDMEFPWNEGHSIVYNMQLATFIPYSLKAIVWYQGESNVKEKEAALYHEMLTCLINEYRSDFKNESLPFVIIQIANYDGRKWKEWYKIQDIQYQIQFELPHVVTVISKDICESDDIHPKNKKELALRISQELIKINN